MTGTQDNPIVIGAFSQSPGEVAFFDIVHFCITGKGDPFSLGIHETYKETTRNDPSHHPHR